MRFQKTIIPFLVTGLAISLSHCAQIDKENASSDNSTGTNPMGPSSYNSGIATHVTSAPCEGLTINGCLSGYNDSTKAINGIRGNGYVYDVFSLSESTTDSGIYGTLVLDWEGKTVKNVNGIDFIVYENSFDFGSYGQRFMDLIVVTISADNINFCGWPLNYIGKRGTDTLDDFQNQSLTPDPTQYSLWPETWINFAGKSPVVWNNDAAMSGYYNPMGYDDLFTTKITAYYDSTPSLKYSRSDLKGGGDGFDLDNLVTDAATCTTLVLHNIVTNGFKYVKLTAARSLTNPVTGAIYPHYAVSNGPDIDGVVARHIVP